MKSYKQRGGDRRGSSNKHADTSTGIKSILKKTKITDAPPVMIDAAKESDDSEPDTSSKEGSNAETDRVNKISSVTSTGSRGRRGSAYVPKQHLLEIDRLEALGLPNIPNELESQSSAGHTPGHVHHF